MASRIFAALVLLWSFAAANFPFQVKLLSPTNPPIPHGPDEADVLLHRSRLALARKDYFVAQEFALHAVERQPAFAQAHMALATALEGGGDLSAAQRHFRRAIYLNPSFFEAYLGLGRTSNATGVKEQALEAFRMAALMRPDAVDPWIYLGEMFALQGSFQKAEAAYRNALERDPRSATALEGIARLKLQGKLPG